MKDGARGGHLGGERVGWYCAQRQGLRWPLAALEHRSDFIVVFQQHNNIACLRLLLEMKSLFRSLLLACFISCLVSAHSDDSQTCADATHLLPFLTEQMKQGMNLIVFQGQAAPQVRVPGHVGLW